MQDLLHAPRLQALQEQAQSSQSEIDKRKFLVQLAREIVQNLSEVAVSNFPDSVNVSNMDEVKAALRNELAKANKPITDILNKINTSIKDQTKFIEDVEKKAAENIANTYETVTIKRLNNKIEVDNLGDIVFPSEVKVNNLSDLEPLLKDLSNKIAALKLAVNLPAPQVTVNPTPVHIPETVLNIPPVDLSNLIKSLELNLNKLRTNSVGRPLAVRLSDGNEWLKQLVQIQKDTSRAVAAFAGGNDQIRILDANRNIVNFTSVSTPSAIADNSQTVTTAGTRVQLITASTPCRYVIIVGLSTNTDTIWVGGSTVAAGRGRPLVSLQSEKLDIDNVNKVWIDSVVNGEGVSFCYVA